MKNIIFTLFATVILVSCNKDETGFTASIDGVADSTNVYVSKLGKNNQPVPLDTVQVMQGSFSFNMPQEEPQQINMIKIDGVAGNLFFVYEKEPIKATLYKDSLRSSIVTGGKHNKLLMSYMDTLKSNAMKMRDIQLEMRTAMSEQDREKYMSLRDEQKELEEKDLEFRKEVATENKNSIIAALSLSDLMGGKKIPNTEIKDIYDSFSNEVKDHTLGRLINENIAKMSKTDIGAVAMPFEAPTPEGDRLSLEDAMGKLTLIDFWASWCKPCRMENPNVVSVYNDYKDKGFNIISVSLDKNKSSWEKAIVDDNMDWYHVSNLKYWSEPIAVDWGVRSIPATFLIDEKGVIVAKNLRGAALRQKVDEILGE
jgi:thiol-disulfide isomerase/thioredoxin